MNNTCRHHVHRSPRRLPWRRAMAVLGLMAGAASALAQTAGAAAPAAPAQALSADAPGPVGGAPDKLPDLKLPSADQLRLVVPRPIKAATAALGYGRQRLALVLGIGTVGSRAVLDSAPRDTLAVATALRQAGFVVMVREDVTSTDLRASLKEFRERLQPGGMGLLYATALGAQLDGRNLLLPREASIDAAAPAATVAERVRSQGVPVQELVDALLGTSDSPRMLVVDAAYKHPALDKLPQAGLVAQALPPGMMALFAQSPQVAQEVPAVAPLPTPAPTDPQLLAASPFARLLVRQVLTPKLSGAEVLRSTHRALVDSSQGAVTPWIAGDTDAKEEMAELTLLDAVLPRTPEEYAREGVKRAVAQLTKPEAARAGEQPVSEVLQQAQAPTPSTAPSTPSGTPAAPGDNPRNNLPDLPGNTSALGSAANALGTVASVAGTVAGVAGTAATVAVGLKAAQAAATASVASTAVSAATAVAGNAVALATRLGSGGSGEGSARQVASAATAAPAVAALPVAAPAPVVAAATPAPAAARSTASTAARTLASTAGEMSVSDVLKDSPPAAGNAAPPAAPATSSRAPAAPTADPTTSGPLATDGRTLRNASGGERPVYNPRTNSHGYAEGDTFTYRVTDTWKDEVTGRYTTAIEEVLDNGQMLANGQQIALDPEGRLKLLRGADGAMQQFEPYQDLWWSKPTAGQSRDVNFKEIFQRADKTRGETQFEGSSRVGRLQKVETPAGEFDALPIETSGWYHEQLANGARTSGKFERTVWYSPKLGHPVAIDIKDTDRLGKLLKRERVELMHAQQMRNPP